MTIIFDKINSIGFSYIDRKAIGLWTIIVFQFRPCTLVVVQRYCLRMAFFILFVIFIFSNFELKSLDFSQKTRTLLWTLLSNSHEKKVDHNFFQWRVTVFFQFRTLTKTSPDFAQWPFGTAAKTALCIARWRLHGMKIFLGRIYCLQYFMIWITYFLKCLWKASGDVVKTAFIEPERICWVNGFFDKLFELLF